MSTATLCPPNAILFLYDRGNRAVNVPKYIAGELVASNDSCVSVGTQAEVDGDVTVVLEAELSMSSGVRRVFIGNVSTPTRKLSIVTADAQTILECDVAQIRAELEVWVDDLKNPSQVFVSAR